jgi:hypothetical protein
MKVTSFFLPVLGVATVATILAQPRQPQASGFGRPAPVGENLHGPIILNEVKHDVSPAVRDMDVAASDVDSDEDDPGVVPAPSMPQQQGGPTPGPLDTALQLSAGPPLATTSGLNFDGQVAGSWNEPDSNGAVGATQYIQWVNVAYSVYDKVTGGLIKGPISGSQLWKGFGGACQATNSGDPVAQYDKAAARWVMTQRAAPRGGPYYQCVAVSTTSDATGTFYRYAFQLPNDFPDYPKLGVWPDAYYVSINLMSPGSYSFIGPYVCAFDRNSMLSGAPATGQCFQLGGSYSSLLPSDLDGLAAPPGGSPNYFVSLGKNSLNIWQFHVDFGNPSNTTLSGPTNIAVAAFSEPCRSGVCIPQNGTSEKLDALGDRLMYRLAYRNFGDHEALVATHSVVAGSSVGVRWYEIRSPGNHPVVYQQETYAPDSSYRWLGSIAMDKAGDIAVGYSVSSPTMFPSISYTGRVPTDTLGTMEAEASIMDGSGSETPSIGRWGDYSSLSVDPVDDCTFWYTNEYLRTNGDRNWRTRIASFKFNGCQ